ncbi:MAG: tetratricopeptide repeat protein [Myxococcota bacterium]
MRRLLAVALAAALLGAGCGPGDDAAPHLAKAEALSAAGKTDQALIELRLALQAEPKNADVNFRLAKLLHQQEKIPDAVFFYEEALRLDPHHAEAALTLAFLMLGDDVGYSERLVNGVIERDPQNALAWVRRSDIALTRRDADGALSAALTAAELEPENARAQIQVGIVQRARIRQAGLLGETPPDALFEEALAAFERASQGADDSPDHETAVMGWVERANTLATWPARKGEAAAAYREAFAAATKLGGSQDLALDAALDYARRGRDAELRRWVFERSVEVHPERLDLWRRLAQVVDPPNADHSPTLARMVAERADDAHAHAAFARDLAARGRTKEAIAHLETAASQVKAPEVTTLAELEIALEAGDDATARKLGDRLAKNHPGSLEDRLAQVALHRRAGDFAAAADALEAAIDAYGATPPLATRLAELRFLQGDAAGTLEAAEQGLQLARTPMQKLALLRLQSRAQIARGAYDAAAVSFARMVEITEGRVATPDLVPYAQVLYATKREGAARSMLETALGVEPLPVDGVILFARREGPRDPKRAEQLIERALASAPRHPGLLEEAARFDLAAGRVEQAKARLAAAIEAAPDYAPLHTTLARVLLQTGDPNGAIRSAEEALRLDPNGQNPLSARVLVAAYDQLGRTDEAVKRLQASNAAGKLGLGGQVLLARLLTASGDRAGAIALLEAVVAEAPDLAGPKNDLAYLLVASGKDLDRALSLAQEARAAMPLVGGVADTLGYAYLAKRLPDAALPQFDEAVSLSEAKSAEWGLAQLHRAQALHQLGRTEAATEAAKSALEATAFEEQKEAQRLLDGLSKAG